MNVFFLILPSSKEKIKITVTRKRMKNVRLKIFPDLRVVLSSPKGVSDEWLAKFINEKNVWIEEKLAFYKKNYESKQEFARGISTKVLGRDVQLHIEESCVKKILHREDNIIIYTPDKSDHKTITKQLDAWWRNEANSYYEGILSRYFPIIEKYQNEKPRLYVRKMKTLWGSYSVKLNKITINYTLFRAVPPCVEYVIFHELVHVLYPNHSKHFYDFLSIHMPDWKDRKRLLNSELAGVY